MRDLLLVRLVAAATSLVVTLLIASEAAQSSEASAPFNSIADQYIEAYQSLNIPPLHLALADNLVALGTPADLARQQSVLENWQRRLANIEAGELDSCALTELARLREDNLVMIDRARLGQAWLQANEEGIDAQSARLATMEMGKRWYRWLIRRWLGGNVSPGELLKLGERDLLNAQSEYRRLQSAMGFVDDHDKFRAYLDAFAVDDSRTELDEAFSTKQASVHARLPLLYHDYSVKPALIVHSKRQDFAVPGWYDVQSQSFHYNVLDGKFDVRQVDWLFLHEATPGHHFQINVHTSGGCENRLGAFAWPGFLEGWAAYVETQGKTLGLYANHATELAAIEWDLVRSARVILDVRLNHDGWTERQAHAFWAREVFGQEAIAEREIKRMQRWPAQVHTYKFGADQFARQYRKYMQAPNADIRDYHELALSYGPMPWTAFDMLIRGTEIPGS